MTLIFISGATLAIIVAAMAARNEEPVRGLITLVPVVNTHPDITDDPWGKNEKTTGLTPDELLGDLTLAFKREHPDDRDHWRSNPWKMPDKVVRMLPPMVMVSAKLDILY
jgi:acetyl esterase/lipase